MEREQLYRDGKHDHYWIEDGQLYESYMTLRGLRYRHILEVPGMPDCDCCPEEMVKEIEANYLSAATADDQQV